MDLLEMYSFLLKYSISRFRPELQCNIKDYMLTVRLTCQVGKSFIRKDKVFNINEYNIFDSAPFKLYEEFVEHIYHLFLEMYNQINCELITDCNKTVNRGCNNCVDISNFHSDRNEEIIDGRK